MARADDRRDGARHVHQLDRHRLRVKVDGQYVGSVKELIAKSLEPSQAAEVEKAHADKVLQILWNRVHTRFIPGGEQQLVFRIAKTPENARFWEMFDAAQEKWDIEPKEFMP